AQWNKTIELIQADLAEFIKILNSPKTDLNKRIPHGTGQTFLREAMLIIDHTSYHLGEFSIMRDAMGSWGKR
ncbi:MAG: DinB family protein, partial [Microgenomates group bacterium]